MFLFPTALQPCPWGVPDPSSPCTPSFALGPPGSHPPGGSLQPVLPPQPVFISPYSTAAGGAEEKPPPYARHRSGLGCAAGDQSRMSAAILLLSTYEKSRRYFSDTMATRYPAPKSRLQRIKELQCLRVAVGSALKRGQTLYSPRALFLEAGEPF